MKTIVRYYSKRGNTKTIAEAIAEGAGVKAVSITEKPSAKSSSFRFGGQTELLCLTRCSK